jgi:hypothetical protein
MLVRQVFDKKSAKSHHVRLKVKTSPEEVHQKFLFASSKKRTRELDE